MKKLRLPNKLQNWFVLGVIGVLFGQLVSFVQFLLFGKTMLLLSVLNSGFTAHLELVELAARSLVWFGAGVLYYWWEIGRKK